MKYILFILIFSATNLMAGNSNGSTSDSIAAIVIGTLFFGSLAVVSNK